MSVTEDCSRTKGSRVCFCFTDMCNGGREIKAGVALLVAVMAGMKMT